MIVVLLFGLAAWTAFGALVTIMSVGKERLPLSPLVATVNVILSALIVWLIIAAALALAASK